MSGALKLVGGLTIAAGITLALLMPGPLWVQGVYALSGLVSSLIWFALANILDRLDDLQTIVGRPSK